MTWKKIVRTILKMELIQKHDILNATVAAAQRSQLIVEKYLVNFISPI